MKYTLNLAEETLQEVEEYLVSLDKFDDHYLQGCDESSCILCKVRDTLSQINELKITETWRNYKK